MTSSQLSTFFLLLLLFFLTNTTTISCISSPKIDQKQAIQTAHDMVMHVMNRVKVMNQDHEQEVASDHHHDHGNIHEGAFSDCIKLYQDSEVRLRKLRSSFGYVSNDDDGRAWLSGVLTNHRSCLDGVQEKGIMLVPDLQVVHQNLSFVLSRALELYGLHHNHNKSEILDKKPRMPKSDQNRGLLASWDASTSKFDFVVAKDGSGNFKTINEVVAALARSGRNHDNPPRVVIYVKSGVYVENVEIGRDMKNVMFVGDGIDKTIVTGNRNVIDGATTLSSATFGVSGDGFWARDMTFENTAGPKKEQAVALRVASDFSAFYRCSFRGYQDTLLVHSLRQFYRECDIYGTIDFIFGNAATVFQNCNIYIRRPMNDQSNLITAQGRDNVNENTGISIHGSRVLPAPDFRAVKGEFKSYLGRPWKKYSRTVFLKTDLDGLIDPRGWKEWRGDFGLLTLFYGEYMNSGDGAFTGNRVKWVGFHVLNQESDVWPFTVSKFIQGESWIPETGLPFSPGV